MTTYHAQRQGDRSYQEDYFTTIQTDHYQLLVVADGLGGHDAGDVAAKLIVELVTAASIELPELSPLEAKIQLRAWFEPIVKSFQADLASQEQTADAHTTVAIAIIRADQLYTLTVGDSRVYVCGEHSLWRSRDHSVVQMLVDDGEISEAEMAAHPEQGKLYQSIGPKKTVKPRVSHRELTATDVVLVASDGFWEGVSDEELQGFAIDPSQQRLDCLVDLACERRAPKADNTTVISFENNTTTRPLMTDEVNSTPTASAKQPDNPKRADFSSGAINRRRDRFIALGLVLLIVLLVVWGGSGDDSADVASAEQADEVAQTNCMLEAVYEAEDEGIRIVLSSIDDGTEQIVTLPIRPGKYRVRLEDRHGECQNLRDEEGETELKKKFERQLLRSSTVSMEVL